jgi:hypothetical protein
MEILVCWGHERWNFKGGMKLCEMRESLGEKMMGFIVGIFVWLLA